LDKLGINVGNLLVQIFNFLIVLVVLRAWVYKPLLGMLEKRQKTVEKGLDDARVAAEARANAEKDAAEIMSEAQAKVAQTIREATERQKRSPVSCEPRLTQNFRKNGKPPWQKLKWNVNVHWRNCVGRWPHFRSLLPNG